MSTSSRLPLTTDMSRAMLAFLDNLDRKQLALSQTNKLDTSAALADVIAKINEIITAQN